jgi:hypothetical protein
MNANPSIFKNTIFEEDLGEIGDSINFVENSVNRNHGLNLIDDLTPDNSDENEDLEDGEVEIGNSIINSEDRFPMNLIDRVERRRVHWPHNVMNRLVVDEIDRAANIRFSHSDHFESDEEDAHSEQEWHIGNAIHNHFSFERNNYE